MNRVLVTCPPMCKQINNFSSKFVKLNWDVYAPEVIQTLSESELIELVQNFDGWIIGDDPATKKVFEAGKQGRLKAAVKWGVGVDNVDFDACRKLGIPIKNTPGMFGAEVADLAMCYILGLARDAFFIDREVRNGFWPKPSGVSLSEKTIGIVGLGDIGRNIAKRAIGFDMKVIGWDPFATSLQPYIEHYQDFPKNISECDFIVLACNLNDSTKYILNEKLLEKYKKGVRIVNVSRGGLIQESALLKGLEAGVIASVALDVFEVEPIDNKNHLLKFPQCIFGSHNASNTHEAVVRASDKAIQLLSEFLK